MSEYLEIVELTVAEEKVEDFLKRRPAAIDALGEAFPGLLDAWLARFDDGTWVDLVRWRSREEAEAAAVGLPGLAAAASWVGLISEVTRMRHAAVRDARSITG